MHKFKPNVTKLLTSHVSCQNDATTSNMTHYLMPTDSHSLNTSTCCNIYRVENTAEGNQLSSHT